MFISIAAMLLVVPEVLIFFGISVIAIFVPFIFISVVFLVASPILISKGAETYEQV